MNDIQKYRLSILEIKSLQTISVLPPLLHAYEIRVFTLHLPDIWSEVPRLFALLSSNERERAERFHFDRDANLFIVAHGLLRVILAHYLQLSPQEISFITRPGGKPILSPTLHPHPISFNISHSGETVLVGVSADAEIGVDVEVIRPFDNFMEIAEKYFHPEETLTISNMPQNMHLNKFYEIWTQKEAAVKALGIGLACPLNHFKVSNGYDFWGKADFSCSFGNYVLYGRQIKKNPHWQGSVFVDILKSR